MDGFALADLDLKERREGDVLGRNQSGKAITLRLLSLADHLIVHRGCPRLLHRAYAKTRRRTPDWRVLAARFTNTDRIEYLDKSSLNRKVLLWLSAVAVLALVVAYQTLGSSAARHADEFAARADVPTVHAGTDVLAGSRGAAAAAPLRLPQGGVRRRLGRRQRRPGGHNGCDTRDDILAI